MSRDRRSIDSTHSSDRCHSKSIRWMLRSDQFERKTTFIVEAHQLSETVDFDSRERISPDAGIMQWRLTLDWALK